MRSLLALLLVTHLAHAHGPAPAALGSPSADLSVVRTNIGLAFRRAAGGYRYVCPATWDAEEHFPTTARLPDGRVVVAHDGVAYLIAADGCGRVEQPLPDAGTVTAIIAHDDAVWISTREDATSDIWRVDGVGPPVVARTVDAWVDSMAIGADGELLLAAARPAAQIIRGDAVEMLDFDAAFIALRGGGRFLRTSTDQGIVLLERDGARWIEHARAFRSVHGPVRFGSGWLAIVDGWIHHRTGDTGELEAVREDRWTCLERRGDAVLTCVDFGLAHVATDLTAEPAFALDELVGVDCPEDPATHARCDGQWLHFGAEAGLVDPVEIPARPMAPEQPRSTRDDGCTTRPGAPTGSALLWLLPLALRRRIATLRPTARSGQIRSKHVEVPDSGRDHRCCRSDRL